MRPVMIVVGGHSRSVGKTTTIEEILGDRTDERWAAVKVSSHRHALPDVDRPLIEPDRLADPRTQTGRYLLAGAERAFLCRTPAAQLTATAAFIRELQDDGCNVIVESNRIIDFLRPDLVLFTVAPRIEDWKASSGVALARTDAFVVRTDDEAEAREAVRALAAKGRTAFAPGHGDETLRMLAWLQVRLPATSEEWRQHVSIH
ncbi:MAG: hypothetical protein FJW22_10035 [Acidimicrobiia bacterium]|nr:hypothetical protein [Acidimicrobiia bacterium]